MKILKKVIIILLLLTIILPYTSSIVVLAEELDIDNIIKNDKVANSDEKLDDEESFKKENYNEIKNEVQNNISNNTVDVDNDDTKNETNTTNEILNNTISNDVSNIVRNTISNSVTNTITNTASDKMTNNTISNDTEELKEEELLILESPLKEMGVKYSTHVENKGWEDKYKGRYLQDGEIAGTIGESLRLEAIKIELTNKPQYYSGDIVYETHVQNIGWQDAVTNGRIAGTSNQSLRLEAIKIRLTGDLEKYYDIYYTTHAQNVDWLKPAKNGEISGTAGYGYRLEGIRIAIVKKGENPPTWYYKSNTTYEIKTPNVEYSTYVQNIGWQNPVTNGKMAGTSNRSLRLEGIKIRMTNNSCSGNIEYETHVQNVGWQNTVTNGEMAGTRNQSLRLEAIKIRLTGELSERYDIYYRTHAEITGWLGWAKNGEVSGTEEYGYRLEAIEIVIKKKGDPAPGSTENSYRKKCKGMVLIDEPKQYEEFTAPNKDGTQYKLKLKGWAIATDEQASIQINIDDKKYLDRIDRYERKDVNNTTVKKWEEAIEKTKKSGFEEMIDISNLNEGTHKIIVTQKNRYGETIGRAETNINVKKPRYNGKMVLDTPSQNHNVIISNNQNSLLEFKGWAISDDSEAILRLYVNNELWISNVTRYNRSGDVNNKTLPNCEEQIAKTRDSGFASVLTFTKDMLPGKYVIKIEQISKFGHVISSIEREINLINVNYNYTGRLHIDSPIDNRIVIKERNDSFKIRGWAISNDSEARLEIWINNNLFDSNPSREYRSDVNINTLPGCAVELDNTPFAGYTTTDLPVNVLGLAPDLHTIKVRMIDRNGKIIAETSIKIRVVEKNSKGIDVSKHNGTVDWNSVINNGFTFAILRVGYGRNDSQKDIQFEENYRRCKELGISVGVYLYSYAMDPEGAEAEAENCLRWLNGRGLDLPVYYDLENDTASYPQHTLPRDTQTEMVIRFCDKVQSAGYRAGVYASKYWMQDHLDMSRIENRYAIWVAHYTEGMDKVMEPNYNPIQTNYSGRYNMWQYTSKGNIGGKYFDFNIFYY